MDCRTSKIAKNLAATRFPGALVAYPVVFGVELGELGVVWYWVVANQPGIHADNSTQWSAATISLGDYFIPSSAIERPHYRSLLPCVINWQQTWNGSRDAMVCLLCDAQCRSLPIESSIRADPAQRLGLGLGLGLDYSLRGKCASRCSRSCRWPHYGLEARRSPTIASAVGLPTRSVVLTKSSWAKIGSGRDADCTRKPTPGAQRRAA